MERRLLLSTYTVGPSPNNYATIQAAINAADGDTTNDTISIASGTYTEQLTIAKPSGTLLISPQNDATVTIKSPGTLTADINGSRNLLTITNGSGVTLSGLTITGPPGAGSDAIDTGVFVEGRSTATLVNDTVANISDNPIDGIQSGVAIQVGQASFGTVGTATITNVTISGYQKNGITIDGSGSSATVTGSSITGAGPTAVIAQNGIQISRGATASISGNTISNNESTSSSFGTGIYLSQSASGTTTIASNTLTANDFGVYSTGTAGTTIVTSNTVSGDTSGYGIYSSTAGTTTINNNTVDGNYGGIDSDSTGPTTINGNILGSVSTNTSAGIEVDGGTVNASNNTVTGGAIGIDAVSYDGNVTLNLNGSTITNATTGIAVDSTPDAYSTTVNVDKQSSSPPTLVTSTVSGAHGAVISGASSTLATTFAPMLTISGNSPVISNNSDGTFNATYTFSGSDNVTSANDLVYTYQLDGGAVTSATSPLTLSNLSAGTHSIKLTVTDQGGLSTSNTYFFSNANASNPTVSDGGFETPAVGVGNYQYDPTGTPWTYTNSAGVTANNSPFTYANPAAPEGAQVGFIQMTGSFSQSVNFASAGSYNVAFQAAQRGSNGTGPGYTSIQDFEVLVDNQIVGTFKPASTNYGALTTPAFTVTAGYHSISFVGLDTAGGDNTAFVDNVTVNSLGAAFGDGGFETPAVGNGNYQYDPTGTPWTYTNSAGVTANNSPFTFANPAAPEGTQVGFIQQAGSMITQTINIPATGSYTISFQTAQRGSNGTGPGNVSVQDFKLVVDGQTTIGIYKPSGVSYQAITTASFNVSAGSHTFSFVGLDSAGGDNTAFIDKVTIAAVTQAPLVSDGGFETPAVGNGNYQYDPTGTPWTYANSAGVTANNSPFTFANPAAPEGTQVGFIQQTGSIAQTVTFQSAGSYTISLQAAQRGSNGTGPGHISVENFAIFIDNQSIGTFQPSGLSYQSIMASFSVTAGSHTISFVGIDSAGGDNTAFIDNVVVATS